MTKHWTLLTHGTPFVDGDRYEHRKPYRDPIKRNPSNQHQPHPFIFDDETSKPFPDLMTGGRATERYAVDEEHPRGALSKDWLKPLRKVLPSLHATRRSVGSRFSHAAQAYGYPVVSTVPTPETSGRGVAFEDKRVRSDRFNLFGE